jgi:hypothetical protein
MKHPAKLYYMGRVFMVAAIALGVFAGSAQSRQSLLLKYGFRWTPLKRTISKFCQSSQAPVVLTPLPAAQPYKTIFFKFFKPFLLRSR